MADDNKPLMKESRFSTFKKKYDKYKLIYDKNKNYEDFANWFFEKHLLGYSYSKKLKDVFSDSDGAIRDSVYFNSMELNQRGKFIGTVEDSIRRTSANGNQYIKVILTDEHGTIPAIIVDNRRKASCTDYISSGGKIPEKGNILIVVGRKGEDIIFIEDMNIMDEKIYMKLADIK